MADNVYSNAKIINNEENIEKFELGNFVNNSVETNLVSNSNAVLNDRDINGKVDPVLVEIRNLQQQILEVALLINLNNFFFFFFLNLLKSKNAKS